MYTLNYFCSRSLFSSCCCSSSSFFLLLLLLFLILLLVLPFLWYDIRFVLLLCVWCFRMFRWGRLMGYLSWNAATCNSTVSSLSSARQPGRSPVFVSRIILQFSLAACTRAHQVQTGGHCLLSSSRHCTSVLVGPAAVRCRRRPQVFSTSARRGVSLSAIALLLLPAHDSGTFYLPTSSLPHHSQHFVRNWKHIYFGNHISTQTLFCSCVASGLWSYFYLGHYK